MKTAATVLIATALAVIAAATVLTALQTLEVADRLERLEHVSLHICESVTSAVVTQLYIGVENIDRNALAEAGADAADRVCDTGTDFHPGGDQ